VIGAQPVAVGDRSIVVHASIGVALARSVDVTPSGVIQRADAALYAAKTAGRDRVAADTP